jgi:hypothetical protein
MRRLMGFGLVAALAVLVPSGVAVAQSTGQVCITITMPDGETAPTDPNELLAALQNGATLTAVAGPEACSSGSVTSPVASQGTPAPEATAAARVNGHASGQSATFDLAPGDYAVAWGVVGAVPDGGCLLSLSVENAGGEFFHGRIANESAVPVGGMGDNTIHGVPGGSYYVEAIATCDWAVVFVPA